LISDVDSLGRSHSRMDCKLDEGKVIGGKLIVARRDPATLLDAVEESFDPVAGEDPRPNENARRTALQLSLCSEPTFSGAPENFLEEGPFAEPLI